MSKFVWTGTRFAPVGERIAFVTFASGRYVGHDTKLRESVLRNCPEAEVFTFRSFDEIHSPPHPANPYAFKVYAIQAVRALGYEMIVWCDSINRLSQPITSFVSRLKQVGVYLPADGWKLGEWANDRALEYFGVTRDAAMTVECCYACVLGFDFRHPTARQFFGLWKQACDDGIFRGHWDNVDKTESPDPRCRGHRHDQACADLVAYKLGIPKSPPVLGNASSKLFTSFRYP